MKLYAFKVTDNIQKAIRLIKFTSITKLFFPSTATKKAPVSP